MRAAALQLPHLPYIGLYLVLLAGSAESFHALSAARAVFEEQLGSLGVMQRLTSPHGGAHLNVLGVESLPRPLGK
jgi:hypothetical protein